MAIEILINGSMKEVSKQQLFALAKRNAITPDTKIIVNGVTSSASRVKGIVFGEDSPVSGKQIVRNEPPRHGIPEIYPSPLSSSPEQLPFYETLFPDGIPETSLPSSSLSPEFPSSYDMLFSDFPETPSSQSSFFPTQMTAVFTIRVVGLPYQYMNRTLIAESEWFESEVIAFVINELSKKYMMVASEKKIANAPGVDDGKSGCLVMLGFLGSLAAGSGIGCYALLTLLLSCLR